MDGNTVLHHCSRNNHINFLTMLLSLKEIDASMRDKDGYSSLSFAVTKDHTECVSELLSEEDIKGNLKNNKGELTL